MQTSAIGGIAVATASRKKAAARGAAGSTFSRHLDGADMAGADVAGAGEAPVLAAMTGLLGLLDAQEVPADGRAARRALAARRGADLLDRLERLRADVLTGELSPQRLLALAAALREQGAETGEEGLDTTLGEIELRVEVELAKFTRVSGFRSGPAAGCAADPVFATISKG